MGGSLTPDFKRDALLCRLSSAAYLLTPNEISLACAQLGMEFRQIVETPGFQAVIAWWPAYQTQVVAFRGTPITCARDIADWLASVGEDVVGYNKVIPNGGRVVAGLYRVLQRQMPGVLAVLDQTKPVILTGHSLGAASALVAPAWIARTTDLAVVGFAPFQCADQAFYGVMYGGRLVPAIYGRAADFAPGYSHLDSVTTLPWPITHLLGAGKIAMLTEWPWYDDSVPDHAVADYCADMDALAATQEAA